MQSECTAMFSLANSKAEVGIWGVLDGVPIRAAVDTSRINVMCD